MDQGEREREACEEKDSTHEMFMIVFSITELRRGLGRGHEVDTECLHGNHIIGVSHLLFRRKGEQRGTGAK
jgi:hypothetical protein